MDKIKGNIVYVNKNNEITERKSEIINLPNNYNLPKMNLINFIQKNKKDSKNNFYTLEHIGIFHINILENDLSTFVLNNNDSFFYECSFLNDIILKETLPIFFEFSNITIILKKKKNNINNNTKKVYIGDNKKLKCKNSLKKKYNNL